MKASKPRAAARTSAGRQASGPHRRIASFDILRGFSVCSMVCFHLCYDLRYLAGAGLPWFDGAFQDVWRDSISWTFLFIAGCMCSLSRDNFRRAGKYLLVAALIYAVTAAARVDIPISFGIIFCMGVSTLLAAILQKVRALPSGALAAAILLVAFVLCLGVPSGTFGIGRLSIGLPSAWYEAPGLAWLGLPGATFESGDYYPMIPFTLMYLAGAAMGAAWAERGYPAWCYGEHAAPLAWVGRHALAIYIIHQPVLLLCCGLL